MGCYNALMTPVSRPYVFLGQGQEFRKKTWQLPTNPPRLAKLRRFRHEICNLPLICWTLLEASRRPSIPDDVDDLTSHCGHGNSWLFEPIVAIGEGEVDVCLLHSDMIHKRLKKVCWLFESAWQIYRHLWAWSTNMSTP